LLTNKSIKVKEFYMLKVIVKYGEVVLGALMLVSKTAELVREFNNRQIPPGETVPDAS
jgi:hypothetical protein|tara:strand:+ start:108 stop:281 length:174 start_codon:yes stop_codon:yes gene_type:complete